VDAEYRTADLQRSAVDIFVSMAKQSSLTPLLTLEKGAFYCGCTKNMNTNKGAL